MVNIPGEETTFISQPKQFDGLTIIRRPATDHPDLDMSLTIIAYIQQYDYNTGYVIAKGYDDQMRDWGLLLAYNRIEIVYRINEKSYETITFSRVTVADGHNHSIAAVIDSTNKQALISVDGVVYTAALNELPIFQPGVSLHRSAHNYTSTLPCSSTIYILVEGLRHMRQLTIGLKAQYTIYLCTILHCLLMISRSCLLNFKLISPIPQS